MRLFKGLLSVVGILGLSVSLASCGNNEQAAKTSDKVTIEYFKLK